MVSVVSAKKLTSKYKNMFLFKSTTSNMCKKKIEQANMYASPRSDSQMFMWLEAEKYSCQNMTALSQYITDISFNINITDY